ncbi:SpoIIE family protein phosphatase [Magnetospirillum gryphiswaldense]|uniref:Stage II sporulation E n=1 Tax=Magnetospirillum gryphiswaldense TaxID=55518 RepID=A4U2R5_9PROT|nr:SpoIIE family protein phosphatase [Magnetospirillum gryphiswaldense]AVM74564.1 Response regulator MprA [Magnetospirillum gryphiswaldense MSR-1]AVM78467.1 Response regulator MprA [Magnetospirillum gryphiswaldense]CAM77172.1 Stage II sporulation E [Magnetospirillum gryphiswaldense MSR-1]
MTTNAVISADFPAGLALAQTLGLTTNTNTERPGRAVHVIARADQATLRLGLQPPHQGVIEGAAPWHQGGQRFLLHLERGGLGLALTTASAYAEDAALPFAQALSHYLRDAGFVCPSTDLQLVVHEALANALIHGNLAVNATTSGSVEDMLRFCELVEDALADPARAGRMVWLSAAIIGSHLQIAVEDQGAGFQPRAGRNTDIRPHGLDLIAGSVHALRRENDGRTLLLEVTLEQRQLPRQAFAQVSILIVDDNPFNCRMLEALIQTLGVGHIRVANDGIQGLEAITEHCPDLVLLDVMMPRMDGLEMCRRLRTDHALSDLPVLFITALEDAKSRTACFAAGGNDVISKPIDTDEVLARVRVHLQNALLMAKLNAYRNRVRDEMEAARATQASLVPTDEHLNAIRRRTGLSIQGVVESSSELGGDFWTLFEAGPRHLGVLAADFSGHGLPAAFNVFRLHVLLSRLPRRPPPPALMMAQLNRELKMLLKLGEFAAVFIGLIDLNEGTLTYAGAATPPPVLIDTLGRASFLDIAGPPLGAFTDPDYDEWCVPFPPGTSLLVYSDALVESESGGKLVCDDATLLRWATETAPDACMVGTILNRFRAHIPGEPPDDLTLLHIRRPFDDQENAAAN